MSCNEKLANDIFGWVIEYAIEHDPTMYGWKWQIPIEILDYDDDGGVNFYIDVKFNKTNKKYRLKVVVESCKEID